MAVHHVPPLACFRRFVPAMRELWVLDLADEERWLPYELKTGC